MKNNAVRSSPLEWMLGRLGFVLIVLLSWACEQQTGPPRTLRTRVRGVLVRLVIAVVTATGWAVDHIAPATAGRASAIRSTRPIRGHQ